jgi:membrane associated rhomboid family serine protease
LFLAVVSPIAVLARSWRSDQGNEGWRVAAAVVLAVTGAAWLGVRDQAGFVGAGAWFALLFLPAVGLRKVTELAALGRYRSARRLALALRWLHPTADLRMQIRLFRDLEARQAAGNLPSPADFRRRDKRRFRRAPMVMSLIVVNILVFAVELVRGLTNPNWGKVLLDLGALQPVLVLFGHEYWRLIAALFLHASSLHLLFNLFALYVIGPGFERAVGSIRFVICYLLSGICSTVGVIALWRIGLVANADVVGASGCLMGIVGAWAAFLIRDHHIPEVRRRLLNIVMIVVIQTLFDLSTPEVSMSAHICGLIGGFLVGLAVVARPTKPALESHLSYG